jgi:multifunctional beta-oxidation protein
LNIVPDRSLQAKLLHGEQYLAIKAPVPTSGELVSQAKLLEVLDKGKAAAVTTIVETKDKATGKVIFENQSTVFIRGSGGFGGRRDGKGMSSSLGSSPFLPPIQDRGAASAPNVAPKRTPDAVVEEKTNASQAALYRLNGDRNPLHVRTMVSNPEYLA